MSPPETGRNGADWLKPRVEQQGLQRYITTLRERAWLVLATVLLTTAAAAAYVLLADKVYKAEADVLVTPVSREDPTVTGLGLIQESSDPTRDVETAARLVTTTDVARRVQRKLRIGGSPTALLEDVTAEPVAQSNIVAVAAEAGSARQAQALANAFGEGVIEDRTAQLHRQLDRAIARLRARLPNEPARGLDNPESIRNQLTQLETLRAGNDPTLRLETRADLPAAPTRPKPKLSLAAGLLAGLVLGVGGAFAVQVLDPRIRREEQLRNLYGLPILARIPREPGTGGEGALAPEELSPSTLEAYRTLRATLAASRPDEPGPRSILVTSPSLSEGKTTTAVNLASSLALAGNRVILIEADLRRPAVGEALGVRADYGTGSVLLGTVSLRDALATTKAYGSYLRILLAEEAGAASGAMADRLFLPAAADLVAEAKGMADYVIVDSPPLSEVIDALPLAQRVDEVLVIVRLGRSRITKLVQLGELLAQHEIRPVGFAVAGVAPAGKGTYYYSAEQAEPAERGDGGVRDREPAI